MTTSFKMPLLKKTQILALRNAAVAVPAENVTTGTALLRAYLSTCSWCKRLQQFHNWNRYYKHDVLCRQGQFVYASTRPQIYMACSDNKKNSNCTEESPANSRMRDDVKKSTVKPGDFAKRGASSSSSSSSSSFVTDQQKKEELRKTTCILDAWEQTESTKKKFKKKKRELDVELLVTESGMFGPQEVVSKFIAHFSNRKTVKNIEKQTKTKKNFPKVIKDPPAFIDTKKIFHQVGESLDFHQVENELEVAYQEEKEEEKDLLEIKTLDLKSDLRKLLEYGIGGEQITAELLAYVDACLYIGDLDTAFLTLKRALLKWSNSKIDFRKNRLKVHVSVYNLLLHAYASDKTHLRRIYSLLEMMEEAGYSEVEPDAESYAALLECLGRDAEGRRDEIQMCLTTMESKGINPDCMFTKCTLKEESKNYMLKAIRTVSDEYVPPTPTDESDYSAVLLEDLSRKYGEKQSYVNPYAGEVTPEQLMNHLEEQIKREEEGIVEVDSVLQLTPGQLEGHKKAKPKLKEIEKQFREVLLKAIGERRDELNRGFKRQSVYSLNIAVFLSLLSDQQYVELLMKEIRSFLTIIEDKHYTLSWFELQLGEMVHRQYTKEVKKKRNILEDTKTLYADYVKVYTSKTMAQPNHRKTWLALQDKHGIDRNNNYDIVCYWPREIIKQIGQQLRSIIFEELKVDTKKGFVPAFRTFYKKFGFVTEQHIKADENLTRLFRQGYKMHFDTFKLPMLVPPLPWTSTKSGGMIHDQVNLVRSNDSRPVDKRIQARPSSEMLPSLDTLTALGACSWKINEPILDLALKIFREKGDMTLDIPYLPSSYPPLPKIDKTMSKRDRREAFQKREKMVKEQSENYSLWCTELYRLSIANMFRNDVFWLPHNMDFRSRVYTVAPFLQHMGSDLTRGLLMFGTGKHLGPRGLDWLKIHLINTTGFKKRSSLKERLIYANELLPEILDSADNPLEGKKWWRSSDEPWQTLACSMEIAKAIRSPNHEEFISHFPVHQDGTCNGLQHYAALGRDQAGAKSVNLAPSPVPCDVYSDVTELVEKEREADAAKGNEIAKVLEGFVSRKVIKQTVMTTVYGVTPYGAKLQILRQLTELEGFPHKHDKEAAKYLAEKTFKAIRNMFKSARRIQDWFIQTSVAVSKVCLKPMEWTTPLGFPVIQPYYKTTKYNIKDGSKKSVKLIKPNAVKQKNAFPPNFVHSLDATHMMLTSLYCLEAGITFVSVHDCFWTHPCDVEIMNKICREQFIALHNQPILSQLSEELCEKYGFSEREASKNPSIAHLNGILRRVPKKGNFALEKVKKSEYFFS
ncbi:DNA-directed RNA polymerase, mitochondrial [Lingula anatina]|uniref:DNA-directed RNA polymerase n=1 Tax=Lingula anatina TaxID=7574 RepID=A0A1S3I846_LINAN|nr:DNA-directed RNA polymerase, mitochondrial [Lingula anatina]|eukprot:XP_013393549.1 DNA-directed RNA polymerase, mitochondrial [Lingula anatina]